MLTLPTAAMITGTVPIFHFPALAKLHGVSGQPSGGSNKVVIGVPIVIATEATEMVPKGWSDLHNKVIVPVIVNLQAKLCFDDQLVSTMVESEVSVVQDNGQTGTYLVDPDKAIFISDHGDAEVVDADSDVVDEKQRRALLTLSENVEEWELGTGLAGLNHGVSTGALEIVAASIKRVVMGLARGPTNRLDGRSRNALG